MSEQVVKALSDAIKFKSKNSDLWKQLSNHTSLLNRENFNCLVRTDVPVLRCHMRYKSLVYDDFTKINPDCAPLKVIKGRYSTNLVHTNDYFLIFKTVEELQEYFKYSHNAKINELKLNCKEANDFIHYMRFLYPNYLPDLDDLSDLLTIARKSAVINDKSKAKELRKSLKLLLENRTETCEQYDLPNQHQLVNYSKLLSKFITKKYDSFTLQFPQVSRSSCVVLNNFPANINLGKVVDFLWDLKWHKDSSLRIRKNFIDKRTNFATLVLCFDNPEDASWCVQRINNQHLFYNSKLPVVFAELL